MALLVGRCDYFNFEKQRKCIGSGPVFLNIMIIAIINSLWSRCRLVRPNRAISCS